MIKFEKYTMPAASIGPVNPMPDIKNVNYIHAGYEMTDKVTAQESQYIGKGMIPTLLPYMLQDGYNREKELRSFNAAVLENDYIKAVFLPELGGRLWSLYDKSLGRELLYVNPVFQPGNLGLRNAWFSGGVEFNVGIKGHNPLTCSPLWCCVHHNKEGDILCMYEFERIRSVVYSISVHLPEDSPVLYVKCKIENLTDDEKYMYWWSNIAVPETKDTRVFVPANDSFLSFYSENHYILDKASIPVHEGVDVSYPSKIASSRDFFYKIPPENHKWIATADKDGIGLLQSSTKKLYGRKLFVWGQSQGGRNWNEWLSEEGSSYIEIQAGLSHVQLEHIPMPANTTWEWVEAYTALCLDKDVLHGDYKNATTEIEKYLINRVGNPDFLLFPKEEDCLSTEFIYKGSPWGNLEESVRSLRISNTFEFPYYEDEETLLWTTLLKEGLFPAPSSDMPPVSYVTGDLWLSKLLSLHDQNWYSLLHIGVIKYAKGDIDGAKKAWEESIDMLPTAWNLRNLAMLYKNELGNPEKGKEYILKALALKKDCYSLLKEVAAILTECGYDELWLEIYSTLSLELQKEGRLRLYCAIAYMNLDRLSNAAKIINERFVLNDIKEGELSVSHLWFQLYERIYAKENDMTYSPDDDLLKKKANKKYPLPKKLDFRMHD
ncbi:MAG: DUF5107 domain-containing protein [Clostridia bacterium]|nr:DUF5107 domain-containing protein [Clostridia bacterium]